MNVNDLAQVIASLPEARSIGDSAYWNDVTGKILPSVLDDIVTRYDFDFTMADYSSVVTVASQADYILRGANNDLRDIVSIRYGTDKTVLAEYRAQDVDDIVDADSAPSGVNLWYQFKRTSDGFPIVTLVKTPDTAGKALHVRYRLKNLTIEQFPDDFGYVIVRGLMGWMDSSKWILYERAVRQFIKRYQVGGKDVDIAGFNPHMAATNNTISGLYGGG